MPLSDIARQRIEAEAVKRGADPKAAIAEAERRMSAVPASGGGGSSKGESASGGRPVAERLLIGFLPFIKVHELRSLWLGLPDRIPDDEMTCGEYQLKHGSPPTSATPAPEPE